MPIVRRPSLAVALALLVGGALAAPAAAQNLVQNGGFESPFIVGDQTLTGCPPAGFVWCVGQGNIDLIQAGWQPGEGRQSIDLNGTVAGSIFQDLVTTPGQRYDLSFLFSGNPEGDPSERLEMEVFWNGTRLGRLGWVVDPTIQDRFNMLWSPVTIEANLATSALTRLEFRSVTGASCAPSGNPSTACGPALDAVAVAVVRSVPEPATLLLTTGGLLALGALSRRWRASAA